ncbi:hypothetical protein C1645_830082 [Glomus cerebriforme]|uniref:Uncharacterized protein n=1 Tax=Glomus cerebriforme TaxID=658196 RepID=A0A397SPR1_9GLOM|nr:hypothetical protein C1645_830082 [Glomus cerebriforme]
MSFRTAKKHANKKISLDNVNKKDHKKKELVALPSDDLNDLLNNEKAQQSKSKGAKRGRKKNSTKHLNEDKQDENSQNDDEFILSTRTTVSDLRANNPIDQINDIPSNRLILLESRNEITPSNSTSKMISAIPDSRANSLFGHIILRILRPRLTPLSLRDNMMNIVNNSRNISNASQYNFNMTDEGVPLPFNEMMIYQLYGLHFMPSTTPKTLIALQDQGSKSKSCHDFLEKLKCLFLHVQNPQKVTLKELIWKVIKCELNSAEGIEWIHTANRHFGDFHNKLVNSVINLINNFKEKRNSVNPLQKEEIIAFVDESAAVHVLSQWLNATNMEELQAQNSLPYLCRFIRHTFAVNYSSRDTEKMKTLDKITKNIAIPSQNGKNFASNLKL